MVSLVTPARLQSCSPIGSRRLASRATPDRFIATTLALPACLLASSPPRSGDNLRLSSWCPVTSSPCANTRQQSSTARAVSQSGGGTATADPSTSSSSSFHSSWQFPAQDMERTEQSLYDLLGIPRDGSLADIKDAYRQLARRYHPDVRPAGVSVEESTRRFIEVQEAYEILSDPQRRATYDFEMLHGRSRGRGSHAPHAKATWRSRDRSGQPLWDSAEEEMSVKAAWKQQWQRQMDGLRNQRQAEPKPGSWASRMRAQQQQQQQQQQHYQSERDENCSCGP